MSGYMFKVSMENHEALSECHIRHGFWHGFRFEIWYCGIRREIRHSMWCGIWRGMRDLAWDSAWDLAWDLARDSMLQDLAWDSAWDLAWDNSELY